jgi:hypothetical protein
LAVGRAGYPGAMSASFDPGPAPRHQCLNMLCGCNDLVSAGPCGEWCSVHTVEAADLGGGALPASAACGCGHETCARNPTVRGTPERGLS